MDAGQRGSHILFTRPSPEQPNSIQILLQRRTGSSPSPDAGRWVFPGAALTDQQAAECDNEAIPEERRLQNAFTAALWGCADCVGACDGLQPHAVVGLNNKRELLPPNIVRSACIAMKPASGISPLKSPRQFFLYRVSETVDGQAWAGGWQPRPKDPKRSEVDDTRWFELKAALQMQDAAPWVAQLFAQYGEDGFRKALSELPINPPRGSGGAQQGPGDAPSGGQHMGGPGGQMGMNGAAYGGEMVMGQGGYDTVPAGMQQNFPYPQQQTPQWLAYQQFAQQQAQQPPHMQPGGFDLAAAQLGPGGEDERLRFTFPVTVFSVNVVTTGERLGKDKIVAIGACVMTVADDRSEVKHSSTEDKQFYFKVDPGELTAKEKENKELMKHIRDGEKEGAKDEKEAIADFVQFFREVFSKKRDSEILVASENPVHDVGFIDLTASRYDPEYTSLMHLAAAGSKGGKKGARKPLCTSSFACGVVYTGRAGQPAESGRHWATLVDCIASMRGMKPQAVLDVCPYRDSAPEGRTPQNSARRNGWLLLNTMCVLSSQATLRHQMSGGMPGSPGGFGGPGFTPAMMPAPYAYQQQQQMLWQQQQQQHFMMLQNHLQYQHPHPYPGPQGGPGRHPQQPGGGGRKGGGQGYGGGNMHYPPKSTGSRM